MTEETRDFIETKIAGILTSVAEFGNVILGDPGQVDLRQENE
ncbi:hypothetical protein Vi05172_g11874 [Venturia inaequalis]|nr:hypothetical protein Vi05172_g11874 [Venturia inaequalis]